MMSSVIQHGQTVLVAAEEEEETGEILQGADDHGEGIRVMTRRFDRWADWVRRIRRRRRKQYIEVQLIAAGDHC